MIQYPRTHKGFFPLKGRFLSLIWLRILRFLLKQFANCDHLKLLFNLKNNN